MHHNRQLNRQLTPRITANDLQNRVKSIAAEINATYQNHNQEHTELVLIGVLNGAVFFLSDLAKHLTMHTQIAFLQVSSYKGMQSTGQVQTLHMQLPDLNGKHVLLVEDIVDSGLTLTFLNQYLQEHYQPASLRYAVLLDKPSARVNNPLTFPVDWIGFEVANEFLVGYGLDFNGHYRNLPYIAVLSETPQPEDASSSPFLGDKVSSYTAATPSLVACSR